MRRLWKYLFVTIYQVRVLEDPKREGDIYSYPVHFVSINRSLYIRIKNLVLYQEWLPKITNYEHTDSI